MVQQARLEEEGANKLILKEHDAAALQEGKVVGAFNSINLVELLLEELLLSVVMGKKMADDDSSSDFFSQESQPQHLAPCSQDFAFFKAIAQTREDLTTEEEESQTGELSPPSQLVYSPTTSELADLMGVSKQDDFFSSPEGAPALKRRRTLTTPELEDIRIKMADIEGPGNNVGVEVNGGTDDEEEALPLTFHTKEDLIRKLQGIHQLPGGKPCSVFIC